MDTMLDTTFDELTDVELPAEAEADYDAEATFETKAGFGAAARQRAARTRASEAGYDAAAAALTADSLRLYLAEIGQTDLLTAAEEIDLAMKIEAGRDADEQLAAADRGELELTRGERRRLMRVAALGRDARETFITANLRLVVAIAKKYQRRGLEYADLIQAGNLGLLRAVEKFDYTLGYKFSTYATWWIRQSISRTIDDQARAIRVPVHMLDAISKVRRAESAIFDEQGRTATPEQIADRLGMTPERVRAIQKAAEEPAVQAMASLDVPVGEDGDAQIGDLVEDTRSVAPEVAVDAALMQEEVGIALGSLAARERQVLELRFGMADGREHTLEEIGREFGVSRERIRQIEDQALKKLRHPSRTARLAGFGES